MSLDTASSRLIVGGFRSLAATDEMDVDVKLFNRCRVNMWLMFCVNAIADRFLNLDVVTGDGLECVSSENMRFDVANEAHRSCEMAEL